MDEILKIIIERNMTRHLLNHDDIKKICDIVIARNNYNFINQVNLFSNNPHDKNCAGVYYDDHIFFFYDAIIDMIEEHCNMFMSVYQIDGARIDVYNYYFLEIIFHELAHVRQQYLMRNSHGSIEKKLFSLSMKLSSNRDFYEKNYSDILTEVNANNVASISVNYLYSKLPKNFITKNDRNVYQSEMINTLLYHNYEVVTKEEMVISPAERIMLNLNNDIFEFLKTTEEEYAKLIYNNENLTLYKKIMLGLPITYQEYAYVNLLNGELKGDDKLNAVKKLQRKI